MTETTQDAPRQGGSESRRPSHGLEASAGRPRRLHLALIGASYVPLLVVFLVNLWGRPQYQFFPVAFLGALALGWTRMRGADRPLTAGNPWLTGSLLASAWLVLLAASVLWSPWLAYVSTLLAFAGLVGWAGGWRLQRIAIPAGLMALTLLPPPLRYDERLTVLLREWAVQCSSMMLDALRVPHMLQGNIVEIPGQKLLVEEACSGINSFLSVSALTLLFCLWHRRTVLHTVLAIGSTMAAVLFGNTLRIVAGAYIMHHWDVDILSGRIHEWIGIGLMAFYLVFALSIDQFLFFFTERPPHSGSRRHRHVRNLRAGPVASSRHFHPSWLRRQEWARIAAGAFLLLGVAQLAHGLRRETRPGPPVSGLKEGATFNLPGHIGSWRASSNEGAIRKSRAETSGVYSHVWNFENGELAASVALDYPFRGYYDVSICYTYAGWQVTDRGFAPPAETNGWAPHVTLTLEKEDARGGFVWFSTLDEHGKWMDTSAIATPFRERFPGVLPVSYRIQALVTGYETLAPSQRVEAERLFIEARNALARQLLDQGRTQ